MMKVAVFASGTGTNFQNLLNQKDLDIDFSLLVCDKPSANAIKIANDNNIEVLSFNPKEFNSKAEYEKLITDTLLEKEVELIVLAGYMRILSSEFVNKFNNKIINIHPSLLPLYKGATAIKDAFEDEKNIFGVSVHYVNEEVDGGEIILQDKVLNTEGLTLEEVTAKVHELEYKLYPMALKSIINRG